MRFLTIFLLLFVTGAAYAEPDPETSTYTTVFEALRRSEPEAEALDRLMSKKSPYTSQDAQLAKSKEVTLKAVYDTQRKTLATIKKPRQADLRQFVQTMLDEQEKWARAAALVTDQEAKAMEYFKGKSSGYDQDRGPALLQIQRQNAGQSRTAYVQARTAAGAKFQSLMKY